MTTEEILAASAARESALNAAHPKAFEHGKVTGEKDAVREALQGDNYDADTRPPSRLTGDALQAWMNGWLVGYSE